MDDWGSRGSRGFGTTRWLAVGTLFLCNFRVHFDEKVAVVEWDGRV
jgi:hypothetical protein